MKRQNGLYLYSTFLVYLTTQSTFTLHSTFSQLLIQHATQYFVLSIHIPMDASVGNVGFFVKVRVKPLTFRLVGDHSEQQPPLTEVTVNKQLHVMRACTNRLKHSYFPMAVKRLLQEPWPPSPQTNCTDYFIYNFFNCTLIFIILITFYTDDILAATGDAAKCYSVVFLYEYNNTSYLN